MNYGLLYLENSPTYDTDMYVIFDKVDNDQFACEEKTGNGSRFVRHFGEKRPKIAGNRSAFREFEAPSNSGGLSDAPRPRSPVRLRLRRVYRSDFCLLHAEHIIKCSLAIYVLNLHLLGSAVLVCRVNVFIQLELIQNCC